MPTLFTKVRAPLPSTHWTTTSACFALEDFNVTNGPDLRVLLANVPDPGDRDELTAGGYVELDKLKGNVGSQNYPIPETVDLAEVRSVVIYCRPFNVVFAVATLDQP